MTKIMVSLSSARSVRNLGWTSERLSCAGNLLDTTRFGVRAKNKFSKLNLAGSVRAVAGGVFEKNSRANPSGRRRLAAWMRSSDKECRKNREKHILAHMPPYVRIRPSVFWALYQSQNLSISMIIFIGWISNYCTYLTRWFLIKHLSAKKVCPRWYVPIRLLYQLQNLSISMMGIVSWISNYHPDSLDQTV